MNGFYADTDSLRQTLPLYQEALASLEEDRREILRAVERLTDSGFTYQNDDILAEARRLSRLLAQVRGLSEDARQICASYENAERDCAALVEQLPGGGPWAGAGFSRPAPAPPPGIVVSGYTPAAGKLLSGRNLQHEDWLLRLTLEESLGQE